MNYYIIFYILMAAIFAGLVLLDWKGSPFKTDKPYVSLKILGVLPAIMFIFIIILNGTKVSGAIGIIYHLIILGIVTRLKAPVWAKAAGFGWLTLDVCCGIMTLCNVEGAVANPVRLGGHVLCGIWIASVCLFCKNRILKYLGFFIASWLALYSFFGGVLPMSMLTLPGILVVVWLALMGWLYQETD